MLKHFNPYGIGRTWGGGRTGFGYKLSIISKGVGGRGSALNRNNKLYSRYELNNSNKIKLVNVKMYSTLE